MAKRFTDTGIWNREWFMELAPTYKCLIKYLFDNCDACGVWKPNWKLASLHIGDEVSLELLKKHIPKDQFEILPSGKIFLPDFINFQYGKLSKNSPAHNPVFSALEKNGLSDRVFGRVSNTPQEKEKETDKETEKEEEKEKDTLGKSENPFNSKSMVGQMMELWVNTFPLYTKNNEYDIPALKKIADFIFLQGGIKIGYVTPQDEIKGLNTFQLIADQVNREKFWSNKPLASIAKNIQEFYNKIKNPINGTAAKSKSGTGKLDENILKQKLAARAPVR